MFAVSDLVKGPVDRSATLWAVRTGRIGHQLSYGDSLLSFLWKQPVFAWDDNTHSVCSLGEGSEHFKDSLKLAGGGE